MRWRFLGLGWGYAIGEFVIVVAGVLIALAMDGWNDDRLNRFEEAELVERLISDLERDARHIDRGLGLLAGKTESLDRVEATLAAEVEPDDPAGFLGDVVEGAQYGWNQATARRVTFDELLGTGKFGLITDRDLRVGIAEYYALDDSVHDRIDERETRYPHLSYQLVPRANEFDLQQNLSDDEIRRLVAGVFASPLRHHVIAEINLARFMRERLVALQTEGRQLIEQLQTHLDSMR